MLKRSDLPLREQRELNERQAHLNLMMRPYREQRAREEIHSQQESASPKPIVSGAIRRPDSLPVLHMPTPPAAKPLSATEYFAESASRMKREEAEGNVITILHR